MNSTNFINHPIFEKLDQLREALDGEIQEKVGLEDYNFLTTFHQYITDKLKLTVPNLIQETELSSLASEIESGTIQLNSFLGNENVGHKTNAINNFNTALSRVRNLPFPLSNESFDFSKTAASYESTLSEAYKRLDGINKELQLKLENTQQDLIDKDSKISEIEKKLADKEIEIRDVLTSYNNEFESIKKRNITSFEAEKKRFNEEIASDRKLHKEQFDIDKETNDKIFNDQKDELKKVSDNVINSLNNKLEEANKIVNIVGNVGVTGNYQNIANKHGQNANFFRWVALAFMVVMSILLIFSIVELGNAEFNLYKSLVRILAAAVLSYPAVYAAKESTKHRVLETKNRNLELELASIGPFIELLSEDKKQKIKEELVEKYFGNNNTKSDEKNDNEEVSINALEKIIKVILPFIKK